MFNGNRILEIPFFQRAYVWGEDQWERLLEDMKKVSLSNKPYFLANLYGHGLQIRANGLL
ncbi:DUF262 domain-containing protein [Flavobacterium gelatinilyticum]|uniref:DUF262 domain-containing protein n=1 Tax=Flavobacterium gelatinilyticum TaxID=3003260 RepID=UPI00247FDBF6|nr:DUF262 domain-containing protein [Flavobacterium gelatinilyticum]